MTLVLVVAVGATAGLLGWWLGSVRHVGQRVVATDAGSVLSSDYALDAVPLGVVVGDCSGGVIYRNVAADALVDSWDDGVVGRLVVQRLAEVAQGATTTSEQVRTPGPPTRTLELTARPLLAGGALIGASVVFTDVTDQIRQDAMRRDFVANVSHELKTPIGALSLLAETLAGESDPSTVNRLTTRIEAESQRLAAIVEDLLDLSRIEVETIDTSDRVDLGELARDVIERVRPLADRQGISVELSVSDTTVASGSRTQLMSMMRNLVENAVKYSNAGGRVELQVRVENRGVVIEVSDRGIGIPERDLQRVFERFYRVDRARSQECGGSGLGLSIVRNVVERHHGSVELHSTEGQGTTVTVCLPPTGVGVH